MATLVVLVHGLGANDSDFWGSTPTALSTAPRLDDLKTETEIRTWGYDTSKLPSPKRSLLGLFGSGKKLPTIEDLGNYFWTQLRRWTEEEDYEAVLLLGHSMGGLVIAAALGRAFEASSAQDLKTLSRLRGIAFVATPLGGAALVKRAGPLFKIFGGNVQTNDLREDSSSRSTLVTRFVNQVVARSEVPLSVYKAVNDSAVYAHEVTSELEGISHGWEEFTIDGSHSSCVQNLTNQSSNLDHLLSWIEKHTGRPRGNLYDYEYETEESSDFYDLIASEYDARNREELRETHTAAIKMIKDSLTGQPAPWSVLDLGSGTGQRVAYHFHTEPDLSRWVGVEPSSGMRDQFNVEMHSQTVYELIDASALDYLNEPASEQFDVIALVLVLSSLPRNPQWQGIVARLKEGGRLVVADIAHSYTELAPHYPVKVDGYTHALRTRPIAHLLLREELEQHGMSEVSSKSVYRDRDSEAAKYAFIACFEND